jgi:RimJ/RimL family protein N-acetyltransferase
MLMVTWDGAGIGWCQWYRWADYPAEAAAAAANAASRRVPEKNGFALVAVRPVATEPIDAPMALYRLPPSPRP